MRLLSPRVVRVVALGIVASLAVAQANLGGSERDLVARVIRGGLQRLDADGGHGTADGADLTAVSAASPTTVSLDELVTADRPAPAVATPAPTTFVWLPRLPLTSPRSEPFLPDARGRAPPSI